jgi:hypothetical protein
MDDRLGGDAPSHDLDALNWQSSFSSPETSSEPLVLIPHDLLEGARGLAHRAPHGKELYSVHST